MEKLDHCPICKASKFVPFLACKDYTVSGNIYNIVQCSGCGFKFTNPRPDEVQIGSFYKAESYISHTNTSKGIINQLYQIARKFTVKSKHAIVKNHNTGKKILDYGCGTGNFLFYLSQHGYTCTGFEPDDDARKIAISEYGLKVLHGNGIAELSNDEFDVITMWHVLEHIHRLNETLSSLINSLKKGGVLIIAVPNPDSHDAKNYAQYWAAYDVPRHIYHFTKKDVDTLISGFGLKLINIVPMKLDSFYVSMLSEKYKTGGSGLVKGFLSGFISNFKAIGNGNYSSRIYVFKK